MKLTSAVALLAAAVFTTAASASAQDRAAQATVPFNFHVGGQTMPSGTYTLTSVVNAPGIVRIGDRAQKHTVLSMGQPNGSSKPDDNRLVFHRYGSQYFLAEIVCPNASMNIHYTASKSERRAKAEVERAGLAVDPPVLLALK